MVLKSISNLSAILPAKPSIDSSLLGNSYLQQNIGLFISHYRFTAFSSNQNCEIYPKILQFKKMREKSGKKGHRRQISKELIKRKLMEDLFPIPRQRQSTARLKMKSTLNMKFLNTLEFLEFNQIEVLMLHKFEEKLANQLIITPALLDAALSPLCIDSNVYQLIKKLVNLHRKTEETKDEQLIYSLKNLVATANQQIRAIVTLLLFYHFITVNMNEYRAIIKEFDKKRIFEIIGSIHYPQSQLITSKILSALFIILVKYNETEKIVKVGAKMIKLRRMIEKRYANQQKLKVDEEHIRGTLFFNLKYIQAMIKHESNPYQLMAGLQNELVLLQKEENEDRISRDIADIYREEIDKLKKHVYSKIEFDYYHNYHSHEKVIEQHRNQGKIETAIKQFKRRKSINLLQKRQTSMGKQSSVSIRQEQERQESANNKQQIDKNFKNIYNPPKSVQQFSKLSSESNLRKGRKLAKSSLYDEGSKLSSASQKIDMKAVEEFSKQNVQCKIKSKSRQKQVNPNLFMKLSNLYQLTNNYTSKQDGKPSRTYKLEKKRKIEQIYTNFSNLNKIVRQIPRKSLEQEFTNIKDIQIGTKSEIKEMMTLQLINFSAGLQNGNYEISSILNNKGCLQLQFIKVWLGDSYIISIKIQVDDEEQFILKVTLNDKKYNIVLNRGSNVLCERYVTIWPTIRYLVNKKLYQYSIFKRYESLLLIKKMPQSNLIQLQSEIYLQKFGFISKEEIEEINICLDSVFKIILISKHYYGEYFHEKLIKINDEINFPYLLTFEKQQADKMKLNLLSEIYLSNTVRVTLISFMYTHCQKTFLIKIETSRQKLINIVKNKEEMQIIIAVTNLQTFRTKEEIKISTEWHDLERNLIIFQDFKRYVIEICTHQAKNQHFAKKMIKYFESRLVIKYHPIFMWECTFVREANYRGKYYKAQEEKVYTQIEFDKHFQRHRIETVESYCDNPTVPIKQIQIDIHYSQSDLKRSKGIRETSLRRFTSIDYSKSINIKKSS